MAYGRCNRHFRATRPGAPVGLDHEALVTPLVAGAANVSDLLGSRPREPCSRSRQAGRSRSIFIGRNGAAVCKSFARKRGRQVSAVCERVELAKVGLPILDEAIAHVECVLHDSFVAGDHKNHHRIGRLRRRFPKASRWLISGGAFQQLRS